MKNSRKIDRPSHVSIIINPASGKPKPILHILNEQLAGIDWRIEVTRKQGDARRFAKQAVAEGAEVILSFGGDGTLMEIVDGAAGSEIPVLILRGGTGNIVASELGIPAKIEAALNLIKKPKVNVTPVDLGVIDGRSHFILRCGCGLEAETLTRTEDFTKSQVGKLAYLKGLLSALAKQKNIDFRIWLDDQSTPIETSGIALTVANAGRIGWGQWRITPDAEINDGFVDICLVKRAALDSVAEFLRIAQNLSHGDHGFESRSPVQYQQARRVRVETAVPVKFQADGDLIGETPFQVSVADYPVWVVTP